MKSPKLPGPQKPREPGRPLPQARPPKRALAYPASTSIQSLITPRKAPK